METYTPSNSVNKDEIFITPIESQEIKILRDANRDYKLQIIELKLKLKEIHSVLTANTDNLIQ